MAYTGSKYIEDDYISIARGHVKDASHIHKFGAVPAMSQNQTGYLIKGTMSCQSAADATGDMFVRYPGQSSFRVGHSFEVSGTGGQYTYEFGIPIQIPAKADIDVRAQVRSNNARITAAFDIILFKGTR